MLNTTARTLLRSPASRTMTTSPTQRPSTRCLSTFPTRLITPSTLSTALKRQSSSPKSSTISSPTVASIPSPPQSRRIIPLCATWFLPNDPQSRTGLTEYTRHRISGARFFNLDTISDTTSSYPHMLPSVSTFESSMRTLDIKNDDAIVVYDSSELGLFSAPRVAWTLNVFGHEEVYILNNFKKWMQDGYPVELGPAEACEETGYTVCESSLELDRKVAAFEDVKRIVADKTDVQIVDARPFGRYAGFSPEPRPGLPSGHIPGSISVEFAQVLDPGTKMLETDPERLRKLFEGRGLDLKKPVVVSCGTGVTAAVVEAALEIAGAEDRRVYDGSWTEWAQRVQGDDAMIAKQSS